MERVTRVPVGDDAYMVVPREIEGASHALLVLNAGRYRGYRADCAGCKSRNLPGMGANASTRDGVGPSKASEAGTAKVPQPSRNRVKPGRVEP